MLKAISDYAKTADFGIEEMQFEVENKEIENDFEFPEDIPVEIKAALTSFVRILSETSNNSESQLKMSQIKARAKHKGINANGDSELYHLELEDESDGTRKLMSPAFPISPKTAWWGRSFPFLPRTSLSPAAAAGPRWPPLR